MGQSQSNVTTLTNPIASPSPALAFSLLGAPLVSQRKSEHVRRDRTDPMSGQAWAHEKEMIAVDNAIKQAYDRLSEIAETGATLEQAQTIADELQRERETILTAMNALDDQAAAQKKEPIMDEEKIKMAYMDMITDAFSDVLDDLKQHGNFDVNLLVDCLQSGMDILETDYLLDDEDDTEGGLTPHEIRRQSLGFGVPPSTPAV